MVLNFADGSFYKCRLVKTYLKFHPWRKGPSDIFKFLLYPVNNLNCICSRLFLHTKTDSGHAIKSGDGSPFYHAIFNSTNISKSDRRSFIVGNYKVIEVLNPGEFPLYLYSIFFCIPFYPSAWELNILTPKCLQHILGCYLIRPEFVSIKPDPDLS